MSYGGVSNQEILSGDSYETRELEYYLKGVSSLPSINDVNKKLASSKPLTKSEKFIYDKIKEYEGKSKSVITRNLKSVKTELLEDRATLSAQKMAIILTGDWIENLDLDDKSGNYFFKKGEETLIVKSVKVTENI
jgi:hypothetical protein